MIRRFRNIAVVAVTWYVTYFAAGVLSYFAQFIVGVVGDSGRPGTTLLMHLVSNLPYVALSPIAGAITVSAVRPRGDRRWVSLLAAVSVVHYLVSTLSAFPAAEWRPEDMLGVGLVSGLLIAGVHLGAGIARKRSLENPGSE